MKWLEFKAVIQVIGVNPYVLVSAKRVVAIKPDVKKPIPVLAQINGQPEPPWHINMIPRGDGSFYLYLHGGVRKAAGAGVGDTVQVRVCFDRDYQGGPQALPDWFRLPLEADSQAFASWQALTPSRQKEVVRYLVNLKSDEARERNVQKTLHALTATKARFMARDWHNGT